MQKIWGVTFPHSTRIPRWWTAVIAVCLLLTGCQGTQLSLSSQYLPPTAAPSPTAANTIRLTYGEWMPYEGKDLPGYGCNAQAVSEAFALQGIQVEYGFFPWARAYELALSGNWDGTLDWTKSPERLEAFYFSAEKLSTQEWVFFYRADQPLEWNELRDLKGKRIGLTSGYIYSGLLDEELSKDYLDFDSASSDISNLQKLLIGRIDVFPIEHQVGLALLEKHFSAADRAKIRVHSKSLGEYAPYLLLSKKIPQNAERIKQLDQGWRQLVDSGRYAEIMQPCNK